MFRPRLPLKSGLSGKTQRFVEDFVERASGTKSEVKQTFAAANTEVRIRHKLGRVPGGFRVIDQDLAGSIYRAADATKWTRHHVHLKSSVAGVTVRIEVF